MRGTSFIGPEDRDLNVQTDDRLIVLGRRADLRSFGDSL